MKHVILVNPNSGRKNGEKISIRIQKLLKRYNIESTIYVSKSSYNITTIVKKLSSEKCRFYCLGGDGTINDVVQGIIGTDSDIVVLPLGTGNDLLKTISKYKSMRKIILNSINKESTPIDVMKLNNNKYCINILSVGFDAMVAKNVNKFKWIPFISGGMKYNLAIFYTLLRNKNFRFRVRINKMVVKQKFTLIAICNGKYYGGGISPTPEADISDGLLDVCMIDATSVLKKLIFLPRYKKGKHINLKEVNMFKTNRITIVSNKLFPVNIDGEIYNMKKLRCEIIHKGINIVEI